MNTNNKMNATNINDLKTEVVPTQQDPIQNDLNLNQLMMKYLDSIQSYILIQQGTQRHLLNRGLLFLSRYKYEHVIGMEEIVNGCLDRKIYVRQLDFPIIDNIDYLEHLKHLEHLEQLENDNSIEDMDSVLQEKQQSLEEDSHLKFNYESLNDESKSLDSNQNDDNEKNEDATNSNHETDLEFIHNPLMDRLNISKELLRNANMDIDQILNIYTQWNFGSIFTLYVEQVQRDSEKSGLITDDIISCKNYFEAALQNYIDLANLQKKIIGLSLEIKKLMKT